MLNEATTTNVGGIKTSCLDRKQLALLVGEICQNYTPDQSAFLIFSSNGQAISLAGSDPAYLELMNNVDLVHADGQSVVTLSRWFSERPIAERSATTDMIHDIPVHYAPTLKHFFLGGLKDVVEQAAKIYSDTYANAEIVGVRDGYFSAADELNIVEEINQSGADVLWVGLGKPKEQEFCIRHKDKLKVPVVISCGGCYNFLTGHYKRAPEWVQNNGLEWVHRMVLNPRKLFWRYLITNPHTIYLAYKNRYRGDRDTESKKVLFLLKTFSKGGGVERVSANLATSLKAQGYDPEFYVFFSKEEDISQLRQDWPVTLVEPSRKSPLKLISEFLRLRRHVKNNRIGVVISSKETANLISLVSLMFLPRVMKLFTRHCAFDVSDQKLAPRSIKALYCMYALTRSRIVTVSEDLAHQIKAFLPYNRNKVVARANPIIDERIFTLAQESAPIQGDYLCAVGRLCEQKGFDLLLDAYKQALTLQPALPKLVIVGDGDDRAALEKQAADLGLTDKVIFYGFTPNPYAIIKHARLFVMSSRHEGLPTALVEAIALGVPVVSSDCETGPRELLDNGRYGGLAPNQNPAALAQAIVDNLTTPIAPEAEAVSKYRYADAADAYIKLFGERMA
ncbi:glycosyltransferase [Hahella chejuensis KCTC 2396]|uniref:Glycosyltransferase n=1 Tax=Hahella chejuensis (strain KCTC 2396) TaxID=349521 RepID=Q2SD92_HAHCH|nr:WecB/TagA/CpsF family glycosyltransferase [Hahella chejuensis]ABC31382.1 glycosyltransferase [Hahella chejuensis KCTC 2396]